MSLLVGLCLGGWDIEESTNLQSRFAAVNENRSAVVRAVHLCAVLSIRLASPLVRLATTYSDKFGHAPVREPRRITLRTAMMWYEEKVAVVRFSVS